LILCGGKGTRAYPLTVNVPKPLLPVGDRPILQHVMAIYAQQGFSRFVLAGGYLVDALRKFADDLSSTWQVEVIDSGEETGTAERIRRCRDRLDGEFFATYGDGLGNVDLTGLLDRHHASGSSGTMTTVPLPSQYGTVDIDQAGRVRRFIEKPVLQDHWINAGFFVLKQDALDVNAGESLEQDLLPALARQGQLTVYRHSGFWRSMDTYKETVELSALAEAEGAPWLRSPAPEFSSPAQAVSSVPT
jgi:glucose-1-phosphate cytidylyltransferase